MNRDSLVNKLNQLVEKYENKKENFIPILQEMQDEFNFLSETIVNEVARAFNVSQTEIFSAASFYHFFATKPKGKYVIRICQTVICDLHGKDNIIAALESELGIKMGETTPDRMYSLDYANCMGMCDKGPAMLVNNDLYAELTPSKAVDIIRSYK